jgi:hypothetical protein
VSAEPAAAPSPTLVGALDVHLSVSLRIERLDPQEGLLVIPEAAALAAREAVANAIAYAHANSHVHSLNEHLTIGPAVVKIAPAGDAYDCRVIDPAFVTLPDGEPVLREPLTQAQIRERRDKDNIVEAIVAVDFDNFVGESLDNRLDMMSEAIVDSPLLMDIHQTVLRYEPETGALIMRVSGDVSEVLDDDDEEPDPAQ